MKAAQTERARIVGAGGWRRVEGWRITAAYSVFYITAACSIFYITAGY